MSTALISTATPITSFSPQEIIDQLRAENDHLQATLNNSHARFGSISADYTGSRFIPPWSDVKKFYEYQHEMNAIRTALQRAPAGLLPHEPIATLQADPYGGYYQWPTPTPHGLQTRLDDLNDESVDTQTACRQASESLERASARKRSWLHSYLFDKRRRIHAVCRFIYVCLFITGIASVPTVIIIGLRYGTNMAVKVSHGFLWISTGALIIRIMEAIFLLGGLSQVFRGWQDRVGFWASWVLLVVVHATFFAGLFEKLALRGK